MKTFTEKKTVRLFIDMVDEGDETRDTTVTVTNDCYEILDPEEDGVKVSWFSEARCRTLVDYFDEFPTDEEIAALVKKSERAEFAEVVD